MLDRDAVEKIRAATEGVTPGPWSEGDKWVFVSPRSGNPSHALEHIFRNEEAQANAAHVANCDPATINALCDLALEALSAREATEGGEAVAWRYKRPEWGYWRVSVYKPINQEMIAEPLYTSPSKPVEGEPTAQVEPDAWLWSHPRWTGGKWHITENPDRNTPGAEYRPFFASARSIPPSGVAGAEANREITWADVREVTGGHVDMSVFDLLYVVNDILDRRRAGVAEAHAEALEAAARGVLSHREGHFPGRGWLRDNDASRKALQALSDALALSKEAE